MMTREQTQSIERRESWGCLDEWQPYAWLLRRKKVTQSRWHAMAILPFAIVIFVVLRFFPKSTNNLLVEAFVVASLVWALAVCFYCMALIIRVRAIRCPKCHAYFGSEDECMSCGFPRHSVASEGSR
jgi:Zinc-ribbon containing domain